MFVLFFVYYEILMHRILTKANCCLTLLTITARVQYRIRFDTLLHNEMIFGLHTKYITLFVGQFEEKT